MAIIGGGTAGLFLAAFLNTDTFNVTVYEKKASLGRKFLVAGAGGFNLTHAEELSDFKSKYTPASFLDDALDSFSNIDLRAWLMKLGIPTFVGSSRRVFPEKGIKPIAVLKCIEDYLITQNVKFEFNKSFIGWDKDNALVFKVEERIQADYSVFALGGSSWQVTGSDGSWLPVFNEKGIDTVPFRSSNCAFMIEWPETFIQRNEGKPLKNITISLNDKVQKGEVVITKFGIEGNAIYGLSSEIQATLSSKKEVVVNVDFKPTYDEAGLIKKMTDSTLNITTTLKEKIKLSKPVVDLIKVTLTKEEYLDIPLLAKFIKRFPLSLTEAAPIDEAISTSGGVSLDVVNSHFELKEQKNNFCIGEMLDWDAPTGGYLIQACASMGVCVAQYLNSKEESKN